MQGQIHSALLWPPEVSIPWNRVVGGDVTRQSRARSRRKSHEISETLRRTACCDLGGEGPSRRRSYAQGFASCAASRHLGGTAKRRGGGGRRPRVHPQEIVPQTDVQERTLCVNTSLPDKTVHAAVAARGEGVVASAGPVPCVWRTHDGTLAVRLRRSVPSGQGSADAGGRLGKRRRPAHPGVDPGAERSGARRPGRNARRREGAW